MGANKVKRSTVIYRRGRATRSSYFRKQKAKKAYRYPGWVTNPENPENRMPEGLISELLLNLLRVFPKLAAVPLEKRPPRQLWLYRPRVA